MEKPPAIAMIQNWRAKSRTVLGLLVGGTVGWVLNDSGWPWWAWLPAALLGVVAFYTLSVLTWFAYRKLTYQHFADLHRRRRQAQ